MAHCSSRTSKENPEVNSAIDLLAELFPKTFSRFEQRRRPLKVGIRADLLAALDGAITPVELAHALTCYTANLWYLDSLRAGAVRVGLDGEPAGIVTPEEAAQATETYARLLARRARRRASVKPTTATAIAKPVQKVTAKAKAVTVAKVKRMSLAELKAAALRRKAGTP